MKWEAWGQSPMQRHSHGDSHVDLRASSIPWIALYPSLGEVIPTAAQNRDLLSPGHQLPLHSPLRLGWPSSF